MNKYSQPKLHGQTLVEFALILPIFLFLLMVIFDFGRAVYYYSAIHNAAREGARYGVIHPKASDYGDIATIAKNYAIGLGTTNVDVNVTSGPPEDAGGESNATIQVTVSYDFIPVTPFVADLICGCGSLNLTSDAIMRTEAEP